MILETKKLTKIYRRFEKEPGLLGSVRSLLHRKFTEKTALHSFDLRVDEGEFVGLIGPNGAGKTTLVKMLTGIIAPSAGEISVLGHTPNRLENAFKKQYAVVMGQKSQLFFELTAADTFLLFKELYGISPERYRENLGCFVRLFGVEELLNVQVRTLSLGERMKMELIAALLHGPRVLFLDEPTIGLDAVAQRQIRSFLKEVNRQKGTTILLTSHYMDDIRSLCERCVVVNGGEKIYDGGTAALFEAYRTHKKITLTFTEETAFTLPEGCVALEQHPMKAVFLAPAEQTRQIAADVIVRCALADIAIEEDEIGNLVERIYAGRAVKLR